MLTHVIATVEHLQIFALIFLLLFFIFVEPYQGCVFPNIQPTNTKCRVMLTSNKGQAETVKELSEHKIKVIF